jgi:uncharacterized protein YjbK
LTLAPGGTVAAQLAAANIPLNHLQQFAEATTIRRTAPLSAGLLTLDQTQYPNGTTDWEAELEYQDYPVALAFWQALQQRFAWSTSTPENKVQRAKRNVN